MSLSYKERAVRRLKTHRADGVDYEPRSTPSQAGAFRDSPVLYYQLYDSSLAPVRKGVTYAHTLEELYYMAIDNASRLGTFDALFDLLPNFSSRNITLRDLILTAFVGTSDGHLTSMLVCPYQGEMPYDLDTSLYATVASDLLPNTRDTPLRIALNAPLAMKRWSHMSRISLFSSSKSDSQLLALNKRINLGQAVELRNDPQGATHYSKKALEALNPKPVQETSQRVAPDSAEAVSDGAQAGTATESAPVDDAPVSAIADSSHVYDDSGPSPSDPPAILNARSAASQSALASKPETAAVEDESRAPIALVSDEPEVPGREAALDVSAITGPLKAARLEDDTVVVHDTMAIEDAQSNPVFDQLEKKQAESNETTAASIHHTAPSDGVSTNNTTTLVEAEAKVNGTTTLDDGDEDSGLAPALPRDHKF